MWNDNVDSVPLNHNIFLVALDRVMRKLDRSGFEEAYCQYWRDQKSTGYIKKFEFGRMNMHNISGSLVGPSLRQMNSPLQNPVGCSIVHLKPVDPH